MTIDIKTDFTTVSSEQELIDAMGSGKYIVEPDELKNIQGKQEYVNATLREQEDAERQAKKIQNGGALVNTQGAQREQAFAGQVQYRTNLQDAAERGLIHSGTLASIRSQNTLSIAQRQLALQTDEALRQKDALKALASTTAATKAGLKDIPIEQRATYFEKNPMYTEGASGWTAESKYNMKAGYIPLFEDERARIEASQQTTDQIINQLRTRQPTQEELTTKFTTQLQNSFQQAEARAMAEARRMGATEDQLAGLQGEFSANLQRGLDVAYGLAAGVTGPDPEQARSMLQGLYNPDVMPDLDPESGPSPYPGLVGTILGGAVGSYFGPAGARAGASIGGAIGNLGEAAFG